ncbi:MAG: hypothetical protein HXY24_13955 [Rubrivivax sp.]|nr:hypothetical protein [Rubrivivax sp.]
MAVDTARECEIHVRGVLLNLQSATDLAEARELYQTAKRMVANGLRQPEIDGHEDAKRGLLALALFVHCVYRTKEAAARGETRLLSVR